MNEGYQPPASSDHLDDLVKPMIYSKRAVYVFAILFSTLFGGIMLMQNLKDIHKKREANLVLIISILITVSIITIAIVFNLKNSSTGFFFNLVGGLLLTEYFYRKYFPDEADYEKKKIWKPLIIGLVIAAVFVTLIILSHNGQA